VAAESLFHETGLPGAAVAHMPTIDTAVVYPGMVLFEATNCSEDVELPVPLNCSEHLISKPPKS